MKLERPFKPAKYSLWEAENNGMNYIILEEIGSCRHAILDWDVSDEDMKVIIEEFQNGGLGVFDFAEAPENITWSDDDFRYLYDIISTSVRQIG